MTTPSRPQAEEQQACATWTTPEGEAAHWMAQHKEARNRAERGEERAASLECELHNLKHPFAPALSPPSPSEQQCRRLLKEILLAEHGPENGWGAGDDALVERLLPVLIAAQPAPSPTPDEAEEAFDFITTLLGSARQVMVNCGIMFAGDRVDDALRHLATLRDALSWGAGTWSRDVPDGPDDRKITCIDLLPNSRAWSQPYVMPRHVIVNHGDDGILSMYTVVPELPPLPPLPAPPTSPQGQEASK